MNSIAKWIKNYAESAHAKTLVVGVSGGVDSALTSALCAETFMPTIAVSLPIHQEKEQLQIATSHMEWLKTKHPNVNCRTIDLSSTFDQFAEATADEFDSSLGLANSRARLRMAALYQIATATSGLVVGTGNKVEDFGVGFFTKYGDGGVDISPIAHLFKSEVRALARELGVSEEIVQAAPTDGLWGDSRTDEDQLGATYDELEWAMQFQGDEATISSRQKKVLSIYRERHEKNLHKMMPIPVFGD